MKNEQTLQNKYEQATKISPSNKIRSLCSFKTEEDALYWFKRHFGEYIDYETSDEYFYKPAYLYIDDSLVEVNFKVDAQDFGWHGRDPQLISCSFDLVNQAELSNQIASYNSAILTGITTIFTVVIALFAYTV